MDRIFKKTKILFVEWNVLDYESPVDESKVSKVNRFSKYNM